jgi:hypothetical protein
VIEVAQYTIQSATFSKEKQVAGNPMHIYVVDLLDGNGQVVRAEVLQRPTSPQPQPGTTVEGEIKPASNPQYLPTFKRAQQGAGGGGGGRGGGGYGPKDIARITRSHSQDMALRFFEVSGGATIDWTTGDAEHLKTEVARHLNNIKRLTDHFDNDVAIAERSVGGQQQAAAPQQQPPPQAPPAQ